MAVLELPPRLSFNSLRKKENGTANKQVLNPSKALDNRGLARISYTICWLAKVGSHSSTEQKEKS
ncbi:hypothetical protein EYF80_027724 [Liparis tanakae]|uniref:Uncharacterized protein n=1 Tax=Liparis tanakae TaxID=230148 RepID=A0A4Z2HAL2_9TELE|nr:hypothetical protein EYF80_027724 [Liparis tanakae]